MANSVDAIILVEGGRKLDEKVQWDLFEKFVNVVLSNPEEESKDFKVVL